ncbi:MAG: ribosomal protein S18-alanine N-acetyltransferase [Clostridia bacterium]|nr:ribosomal protein S18-alanine N-acetyltransferase [Clostridia bacterium]
MKRSDIDAVSVIEEECFSVPWSKRSILEAFSHTPWQFFVAECQKRIVGYGGVYMILDEGQISNIAVLSSFRKNGIAFAILDKIIEHSKTQGASRITLELRESNSPARALYEKCGFVQVGIRPKYYTHPTENAILMDKNL